MTCEALADALWINTSLRRLELQLNEVSTVSALALIAAVRANPQTALQHIGIEYNSVEPSLRVAGPAEASVPADVLDELRKTLQQRV